MRLFYVFLTLSVLFLIPFIIWGDYFEIAFSQQQSTDWLRSYGHWAWLAAVVLLTLDLFLPIPATAVISTLGIIYGPLLGGLIAALGSVLSGALAYGLCRSTGRRGARFILGEKDLQRGERLFARIGGWLVVFSRWLPIFPEVIACLAGLTRMPTITFFAALLCGSLPLAFTFSTVGYLGADQPLLTILLSALLPLLLWLFVQFIFRSKIRSNDKKGDPETSPRLIKRMKLFSRRYK